MNVPKLRFKEFTDEWAFTTLKDIATKVNRVEPNNSPIMMISAEKGFILQSQKYSKDMTGDSLKKYITLYKNELAYNHGASKLRPYGSVFMLLEDKARIPFVYHCFKIINGYDKFFSYCLNRYSFGKLLKPLISSTARMDGLLNISFDNYFSIKFKIPQSEEQKKIANFLSTVDKKISNLEDIITNLEKQKKGLLQQIFNQEIRFKDENGNNYPDWEKKKLGDVGNITKLAGFEFTEYITYQNHGNIIALRGLNIKNNKLDLSDVKYIDNSDFDKLSRSKLYINDLLFTYVGTIGEVALINQNNKYYLAPNVCRIRPYECINAMYLLYLFNSNIIKKEINIYITKSSQPALSMENIRKFKILLPSLEEQTKIADFLSAFDRKIDNQKAQLEHWKQIKKGLLQQMFV